MQKKEDTVYGAEATAAGFRFFLRGFVIEKENKKVYWDAVASLVNKEHPVLHVDYNDLVTYFEKQVDQANKFTVRHFLDVLLTKPISTVNISKKQVLEALREIYASNDEIKDKVIPALEKKVIVRFLNVDSVSSVRIGGIRPDHAEKLVSVDGVVSKMERDKMFAVHTAYKCTACDKVTFAANVSTLQHIPPDKCMVCDAKKTQLAVSYQDSDLVAFQRISLQPLHEDAENYTTLKEMPCYLFGDDVIDCVKPGDRVRVVGHVEGKLLAKDRELNSSFDHYIVVNSVVTINEDQIKEDDVDEALVKDTIDPRNEDEGFEKLIASICPSHYGDREVKTALLLQLVGGEPRRLQDGTRMRGEINILLTSTPGGGKTQLFHHQKLTFKESIYAAGKGISQAGLTVSVKWDEDNNPTILPGAYLLGKMVIIDELDKVRNEDKEVMATVMDDSQQMHLNKMGINKTWHLRVASLHGANPVGGKWDTGKTFVQNIPFAQWILDRYDLKFVILNSPSEVVDRAKSSHFGGMLLQSVSEKKVKSKKGGGTALVPVEGTYSPTYLRVWAQYCRKHFDPKPSQKVIDMMIDFYMKLRKDKGTQDISMREIGNIYRLSTASARTHMRNEILPKDVELAKELIMASMLSCGVDPETGDVSYIHYTGQQIESAGKKREAFRRIVERLAGPELNMVKEEDIRAAMHELGYKDRDTQIIIDEYIEQCRFYVPKQGYVQILYDLWIKKG